ncbi:kinase-like domain-containing protein [Mycena albidolilacea]|uniref:Kinase-like domain-containing protein n=1 Tax=Mycena albidolilacea TaxID=1033008 RepID=A0AAD6ZI57_9AGAR|nr:kinase-like domain-containing protein [Mycena albidolilacea]
MREEEKDEFESSSRYSRDTAIQVLPEKLSVTNRTLPSEHPITYGGFSNIYRGRDRNADGKKVEVALKVLKVFEAQPAKRRHLLHANFTKECFVWHYLKHRNIVPFLSMLTRRRFRVLPERWSRRGWREVACSPKQLNDVIAGLSYLQSANIVHGDPRGARRINFEIRNILIDERGTACPSDFGLAGLIESEPTLRWRQNSSFFPLVSHSSVRPPPTFGPSGVFVARTTISTVHKLGMLMPESLWDLSKRCWKYDASERPAANAIADMVAAMERQKLPSGETRRVVFKPADYGDAASDVLGLLRTSTNHEHELQMGNNQVVELQDEYSSNIQSKVFYNVGPDLLVAEAETKPKPRFRNQTRTSLDAASGPSVSILLGTGEDPSPLSTVKTLSSTAAEGRQRIRRVKGASRTATIRFGPLDFGPNADHDAAFSRSEYPEPMPHITRSEHPGIQLFLYSLVKAP